MFTPEQMRLMMEYFASPAFKQGAESYFTIAQQQGLEAARKFWGDALAKSALPGAEPFMERMAEVYAAMGWVPTAKYESVVKENDKLKAENKLLRDTVQELQKSMIAENGAKAQQAWQEIVDKQLEMSREVTQSFFDVLKQSQPPSDKGK